MRRTPRIWRAPRPPGPERQQRTRPPPGRPAGPAQERRRIYSGSARLLVDDIGERKRAIALLAEEQGGYVEATYERSIVVRVPAGRFQEIFERLLTFGEVQHKSVETQDVTEAYSDLQARLGLAEKTRERLYALLEKTSDVEERLRILREIKRLSEEIERFRLTLELLDRQIAFSRIGVELVPRLDAEQQGRQGIPFRWIAALDPVSPSLGRLDGRVNLDLGDDFAVFSRERIFRAEGPDGTRVRVGTTANRPPGGRRLLAPGAPGASRPLLSQRRAAGAGRGAGRAAAQQGPRPVHLPDRGGGAGRKAARVRGLLPQRGRPAEAAGGRPGRAEPGTGGVRW